MPERDKNISEFLSAILDEAKKRKEQIESETANFVSEELAAAETEAQALKEEYLRRKEGGIKAEAAARRSEMALEENRRVLQRREEIFADILGDVKTKLADFRKTADYDRFLTESAAKIKQTIADCVIFLSPDDMQKAQLLAEYSDDIRADKDIKLGGLKAKNADGSLYLDDTIDQRLAAASEWFKEESGLIIE